MIPRLFTVGLVMTGLCGLTMFLCLLLALRRRASAASQRRERERVMPEIAGAVVTFATGSNDPSVIRQFAKTHNEALENCLLQYHATMSGDGRNRLAELALEIGLVHRWSDDAQSRSATRRQSGLAKLAMVATHEPSRRLSGDILHKALKDPSPLARLEAARTLIHSGDADDVVSIFHVAINTSLMVRIILADELRRHVLMLSETAIPEVLRSKEPDKVMAALEMLAAWERAVPLPEVARLASVAEKPIRLRALRVLPLTPVGIESTTAIQNALGDKDDEICVAAANAAGRMRLESAMVQLARCLRLGRVEVSRAAASALAALPPRGLETLTELSHYKNPVTASASLEALERVRKSDIGA